MLLIFKKVWKKILAGVAACTLLIASSIMIPKIGKYCRENFIQSLVQNYHGSSHSQASTTQNGHSNYVNDSNVNNATSDLSTTSLSTDDYSFTNDDLDPTLDENTRKLRKNLLKKAHEKGFSLNRKFFATISLPKWRDENVNDYTDEKLRNDVRDLWNSDKTDFKDSFVGQISLDKFLFADPFSPKYNDLMWSEKNDFKRIVKATKEISDMCQSPTCKLEQEILDEIANGLEQIHFIMHDHDNRCIDRLRNMISDVTTILDNLYYQINTPNNPLKNEDVLINVLRQKMLAQLEVDTIDYTGNESVEGKIYLNKKYAPLLNIKGMNSNMKFTYCGEHALKDLCRSRIIDILVGYLGNNDLLNGAISDSKNILGKNKIKGLCEDITNNVSLTFEEFMQIEGKNRETCKELMKDIIKDAYYNVNEQAFNKWINGEGTIKLEDLQTYIAAEMYDFEGGSVFLDEEAALNPRIVRKYLHDKGYI